MCQAFQGVGQHPDTHGPFAGAVPGCSTTRAPAWLVTAGLSLLVLAVTVVCWRSILVCRALISCTVRVGVGRRTIRLVLVVWAVVGLVCWRLVRGRQVRHPTLDISRTLARVGVHTIPARRVVPLVSAATRPIGQAMS